jgi:hypothetical protein
LHNPGVASLFAALSSPMKARSIAALLFLAALLIAAGSAVWLWRVHNRVPRATGPLPHEVYVWQRAWTGPVLSAIAATATNFQRVVVLVGEITWSQRKPKLTRVDLDYSALRRAGAPVGLALRIGPFSGPFTRDDATARWLADAAGSLLREARTNGVTVTEFQIDFDCAAARLDGYARWLPAIRTGIDSMPLTITALPAWLSRVEFVPLIRATDGYVLQVHSLEAPRLAAEPGMLCDPEKTQRWIEQAARFGVPFRVALPTYGYRLAFDADERLIGLNAEGPEKYFTNAVFQRELRSDPAAMAAVVRRWGADRPSALVGVIWYRLPVVGDRLNWSWSTMSEVIAGRVPHARLNVRVRSGGARLSEVTVANEGAADYVGAPKVSAHWNGPRLVAADGLAGFAVTEPGRNNVEFIIEQAVRLLPGEQRLIGWLRLDQEGEVTVELLRP